MSSLQSLVCGPSEESANKTHLTNTMVDNKQTILWSLCLTVESLSPPDGHTDGTDRQMKCLLWQTYGTQVFVLSVQINFCGQFQKSYVIDFSCVVVLRVNDDLSP